jgi:hypothetical protein
MYLGQFLFRFLAMNDEFHDLIVGFVVDGCHELLMLFWSLSTTGRIHQPPVHQSHAQHVKGGELTGIFVTGAALREFGIHVHAVLKLGQDLQEFVEKHAFMGVVIIVAVTRVTVRHGLFGEQIDHILQRSDRVAYTRSW